MHRHVNSSDVDLRYTHATAARRTATRCPVALLLASIAIATNAAGQTTLEFDRVGVQQHRDYLGLLPFEQLDTQSGNIILTFSDLVLPGNAGHDLRFQFTFNGNAYGPGVNPWSFGLAGVPMRVRQEQSWPTSAVTNTLDGTRLITPILEMADGGERRTVFTQFPVYFDHTTMNVVRTSDFWEYDRVTHTLKLTDGTTYTYEDIPGADPGTLRLHSVEDVFGNLVTLEWSTGHLNVRQTLKNEPERLVRFDLLGDSALPTSMKFNDGLHDRTWTYEYDEGDAGRLKKMTPPPGAPATPHWTFAYSATGGRLGEVTTPNGGRIRYTYLTESLSTPSGAVTRVLLKGRDLYDRGSETSMGHWQIECQWTVGSTYCGNTTVAAPSFTNTTYYYNPIAVENSETLIEGQIGFDHMEVRDHAGTVVQDEARTYTALPVVGSTYRSAETLTRTVHRVPSPTAYTTTYTYNTGDTQKAGYHCPTQIEEHGQLSRTIERVYKPPYEAPLIVCLLQMERVTVGTETTRRDFVYDDNDAKGFVIDATESGTYPDNLHVSFSRDEGGNIGSMTRRGMTTSFTYSRGQAATVTTPLTTITRTVNLDGTIASEIQGNRTTQYAYDDLGRLHETTPPGGRPHTTLTYDDHTGSLERIVANRGTSELATALDGFGRPTVTVDAEGVQRQIVYDAEGRIVYDGYPFKGTENRVVHLEYDALGRIVRQTNPSADPANPTTRTWFYNLTGVIFTDENGHETWQVLQAFGDPDDARLASLIDADGKLWSYTYHALGQLASVVAPDGKTRSWSYNNQGLLASETHPESGTTTYTYTNGRLTQKTDANGVATTYQYDANNRVKQITAGTRITTIEYEIGSDNRAWMNTGSVGTTFLYDDGGRVALRQDAIDGKLFTSRYEYDVNDDLQATVYPSGRRIEYQYNNEHQVKKAFETATGRDYAFGITYHPSGAVATLTTGNNVSTVLTYDTQRYWPSASTTALPAGSWQLTYGGYDGVGNVGSITDSRSGMNQSFSYDVLDRLVQADGPYGPTAFAYDAHGNRQTNANGTYTYEPGTLRLSSQDNVPFTYYNNGNLQTAGAASFTYTPQNMLETATVVGGTATYTYDADDQRTRKTFNGSTTYYLRGLNGELLTEWKDPGTANGTIRDYVYAGARLVSAVDKPTATDPNNSCGTILPGQTVTVSAIANQNPCLSFTGIAGRQVSALVTAISPANFSYTWWISIRRTSDNLTLGSAWTCCGYTSGFVDSVTIPTNGAYNLLLDPSDTSTGTVSVTLYDSTDITGAIAPNGVPFTLPLLTPGQNARLTFTGTAGQTISATLISVSPSPFSGMWNMTLYKPDGGVLGGYPWACCGYTSAFLDAVTLPANGVYTIVVSPGGTATGTAALRLYNVVNWTGSIAADGQPVTVPITTPGQNGLLTFTGSAGQAVSAVMSATSPASYVGWWGLKIRKADGTPLPSDAAGCCGDTFILHEPITLPETGSYVVVVDADREQTATVAVRLYNVVHTTGPIPTNGDPVTVPVTAPGTNGYLTFTATQGQRVSLYGEGTIYYQAWGCDVWASIFDSSNNWVFGTSTCMEGSGFMEPVALPRNDTYTVVVDPVSVSMGTMTMRLWNVVDQTGTLTVGNPPVGVTISAGGQNAVYTFAGTAGQQATVRVTNNAIGYLTVTLRRPNGSTVSNSWWGSSIELPTETLVEGTYTVTVDPRYQYTGTFDLAVTSP